MRRLAACLLFMLLGGCQPEFPVLPLTKSKELVVAVRESPTTYQTNGEQGAGNGFEYDLLELLASRMEMPLRLIVLDSDAAVIRAVETHRAHLAVGWLSLPEDRPELIATRPIQKSQPVLAQSAGTATARKESALAGESVYVRAGSVLLPRAHELATRVEGLRVIEQADKTGMGIIEMLADERIRYLVTDESTVKVADTMYPDIRASLAIGAPREIVWLSHARRKEKIIAPANALLDEIEKDGTLAEIRDRYFGHVRRLGRNDSIEFLAKVTSDLPKYRPMFEAAAQQTGIDWRLLAALAYQESHWNPLATSPTNVRGMMMLTEETADRLGVTNRLDAEQSITAGAVYLRALRNQLPGTVPEPDRTWIALGAYNLGMGHMNGGRQIARSLGANPDSWYELKKVLPLLARPEYYARLKAGRARGGEAVILVENVRAYYDILLRHFPEQARPGNRKGGSYSARGSKRRYQELWPKKGAPGAPRQRNLRASTR